MSRRFPVLFLIGAMLWGCALPHFDERVDAVPARELLAVSLAREGAGLYRAGRLIDAELKFRQALHLYPDTENVLFNLAQTLSRESNFEEAQAIYSKLLKKNPDSIQVLSSLAESQFLERDYDGARDALMKAYAIAEKNGQTGQLGRISRSLSVLAFNAGQERDALCFSYEALQHTPSDEESLRHVRVLVALHLYPQAKRLLLLMAQRAEKRVDPQALYYLALVDYALREFTEVVERSDVALASGAREAGMMPDFKALWRLASARLAAGKAAASGVVAEPGAEDKLEREAYARQLFINPARLLFLPPSYLNDFQKEAQR